MAITSTMNSALANNTIPIAQACKDGWLPESLATENRFGVSYKILTIIYLFGAIPILLGLQIVQLALIINLALASHSFLYAIAYWNLPKRYPEEWKKSKFHVPNGIYKGLVVLTFFGWGAIFVNSLLNVPVVILAIFLLLCAFSVIYANYRGKDPDLVIEVSMWTE